MGVRFPSVFTNTFIGPLPASAAETIVCTTPPLTLPLDFATVHLFWWWCYTPGTGNNACGVKLRRGNALTGTAIDNGTWSPVVTAGSKIYLSGMFADTPGAVAGQQYTLTVQQLAATVAGGFGDVGLIAFAL